MTTPQGLTTVLKITSSCNCSKKSQPSSDNTSAARDLSEGANEVKKKLEDLSTSFAAESKANLKSLCDGFKKHLNNLIVDLPLGKNLLELFLSVGILDDCVQYLAKILTEATSTSNSALSRDERVATLETMVDFLQELFPTKEGGIAIKGEPTMAPVCNMTVLRSQDLIEALLKVLSDNPCSQQLADIKWWKWKDVILRQAVINLEYALSGGQPRAWQLYKSVYEQISVETEKVFVQEGCRPSREQKDAFVSVHESLVNMMEQHGVKLWEHVSREISDGEGPYVRELLCSIAIVGQEPTGLAIDMLAELWLHCLEQISEKDKMKKFQEVITEVGLSTTSSLWETLAVYCTAADPVHMEDKPRALASAPRSATSLILLLSHIILTKRMDVYVQQLKEKWPPSRRETFLSHGTITLKFLLSNLSQYQKSPWMMYSCIDLALHVLRLDAAFCKDSHLPALLVHDQLPRLVLEASRHLTSKDGPMFKFIGAHLYLFCCEAFMIKTANATLASSHTVEGFEASDHEQMLRMALKFLCDECGGRHTCPDMLGGPWSLPIHPKFIQLLCTTSLVDSKGLILAYEVTAAAHILTFSSKFAMFMFSCSGSIFDKNFNKDFGSKNDIIEKLGEVLDQSCSVFRHYTRDFTPNRQSDSLCEAMRSWVENVPEFGAPYTLPELLKAFTKFVAEGSHVDRIGTEGLEEQELMSEAGEVGSDQTAAINATTSEPAKISTTLKTEAKVVAGQGFQLLPGQGPAPPALDSWEELYDTCDVTEDMGLAASSSTAMKSLTGSDVPSNPKITDEVATWQGFPPTSKGSIKSTSAQLQVRTMKFQFQNTDACLLYDMVNQV